uniref:Uncharacterized protein n=1 Tax=Octopus bimaculoides TaxID=37653 RepID=A0A0L8HPG8_OCTBM
MLIVSLTLNTKWFTERYSTIISKSEISNMLLIIDSNSFKTLISIDTLNQKRKKKRKKKERKIQK